jgi:hypothetical protein
MSNDTKPALYALTPEQHATVLAALYDYQLRLECAGGKLPPELSIIATAVNTLRALDPRGIDTLINNLTYSKGLTFGEVVNLFGESSDNPYVAAALDKQKDGEIEVNDPAVVSPGDDPGAYVMAWIWVSDEAAGVTSEEPQFRNHYRHCGQEWNDVWSCTCNDKCPVCGAEIEPYESEDLTEEASH